LDRLLDQQAHAAGAGDRVGHIRSVPLRRVPESAADRGFARWLTARALAW